MSVEGCDDKYVPEISVYDMDLEDLALYESMIRQCKDCHGCDDELLMIEQAREAILKKKEKKLMNKTILEYETRK